MKKRKWTLEEIESEKVKFQARAKLEKSVKTSLEDSDNSSGIGAKLPKLEISKFQGTFLDWIRFWNQFETEIDKAKLSYLKELVVPSVPASIDRLPFTTQGYERAKHILKTKYVSAVRWQMHMCNVLLDCPQYIVWIHKNPRIP